MEVDVPKTFGALLIGGLYSSAVSGMAVIQAIVYFKRYDGDPRRTKVLVLFVWLLDILHTALMWAGLWSILIGYFGQASHIDVLPATLSSTVVVAGILTFAVHCFLSHRILTLNKNGWLLVVPIIFLALLRFACIAATTAELINLRGLTLFKSQFNWLFTLGFVLSSVVDIVISCSLLVLLKNGRMTAFNPNTAIDTIIHYMFETGSLTAAGTVALMVCWLAMPQNLVFIGLHLVVAKFYVHSLLATLNARPDHGRTQPAALRSPIEQSIRFAIPESRHSSRSTEFVIVPPPIRSPKVTFSTELLLRHGDR